MYILSDIICAWRAVVLWNRDKRVISILLLFILVTTVAAMYDVFLNVEFGLETVNMEFILSPLTSVVPTLATNLLSTGLIAWKFW